jgi:hypothetical protein
MTILIGSRALALRAPSILLRKPKDFDFICTRQEFDSWMNTNSDKINVKKVYEEGENKMIVEADSNCEFEIIKPNSSSELFNNLVVNDPSSLNTTFGLIPNLDLLFTLKSSHKFLKNSPHFWKNLVDYHLMKKVGAKIKPEYKDFLKLREKETYNYSHPKLSQNKMEFFSDDNIKYVYDHDTIHESVARFDKPAYLFYKKDGAEVQCDKNKFFEGSRDIRLAGVIEEAAVLAIERSLVPFPEGNDPKNAWKFALSKVCTSITSGWFREFAYENALEILKLYPEGYWEKFKEDVKSGLVKRV